LWFTTVPMGSGKTVTRRKKPRTKAPKSGKLGEETSVDEGRKKARWDGQRGKSVGGKGADSYADTTGKDAEC